MSLIHTFAVNLRIYRTEQNMSQEYLAELAGLHRTYISAVEREQRNISIENIQRIADALKIEPYRLFMSETEIPINEDGLICQAQKERARYE